MNENELCRRCNKKLIGDTFYKYNDIGWMHKTCFDKVWDEFHQEEKKKGGKKK